MHNEDGAAETAGDPSANDDYEVTSSLAVSPPPVTTFDPPEPADAGVEPEITVGDPEAEDPALGMASGAASGATSQ